ncbi:MAG: N-acetylmuramoyl-L-alanine amidase [Candidatus Cryptobacteroides sp.]
MLLPSPLHASEDGSLGLRTICIDAGHGGKDPGCVSPDKKTYESHINLDIAKRLAALINEGFPDVKVILTRTTDKFVTVAGRPDIANRANADLFLSIHVNSVPAAPSANGFSVHVLGQSSKKNTDLYAYNMEVCKRENSVIMLEDDYSTTYQSFNPSDPESFIFFNLMQNSHLEQSLLFAEDINKAMTGGPVRSSRGVSQDPFLVLWRTSMPAALVEVGFMSNAKDLAVIRSESGRAAIAKELYEAFSVFKKRYDASVGADVRKENSQPARTSSGKVASAERKTETVADTPPAPDKKTSLRYGIQVLVTSKAMKENDPYFKGYKPVVVRKGTLNKYIIGVSGSRDEVKGIFPEVRKNFSGSFLVEIDGDEVKPLK